MVPGMWGCTVGLWPPSAGLSDSSSHGHRCGLALDGEWDFPDPVLTHKLG